MAKKEAHAANEKLQIAVLTLAMTAGGFLLVTLGLVYYLNPQAKAEADRTEQSYKKMTELFVGNELKELRRQAKIAESKDNAKGLREIVSEAGDQNGIKFPNFQNAVTKPIKPGLDSVTQTITTAPASLQSLLYFIVDVKEAKKTIQVQDARFNRDPRSKSEDNLWTVTVEFIDYVTKEGQQPAPAPEAKG